MPDIFISYRRNPGFAAAAMIRDRLLGRGIDAYMDLELGSGEFDGKLVAAIRESDCFLAVLTPGFFDRCSNPGDRVAQEICAAVDSGSRIIPVVICEEFEFPKEWDPRIPDQVRYIADLNAVYQCQHYIDESIDRIIDYMRDDGTAGRRRAAKAGADKKDLDTFFRARMADPGAIRGVDLAFHAGAEWHENIERLDLLTDLAESGIRIRVLVNSPDAAETIAKHMRHIRKKYTTFAEAIELWTDFAKDHPDNVEIRISDTPLLRIYYALHMTDPADDVIRVKYYTYGNAMIDRNFAQNFDPADAHFELYRAEFDFLWNNAKG